MPCALHGVQCFLGRGDTLSRVSSQDFTRLPFSLLLLQQPHAGSLSCLPRSTCCPLPRKNASYRRLVLLILSTEQPQSQMHKPLHLNTAVWDWWGLIVVVSIQGYWQEWRLMDAVFSFHFLLGLMTSALQSTTNFSQIFFFSFWSPKAWKFISFTLQHSLMFIISFPYHYQAHLYHNFLPGASHSLLIHVVFFLLCIWFIFFSVLSWLR